MQSEASQGTNETTIAEVVTADEVGADVVVIDAGQRRNATSAHMHGVLGHDGSAPGDFLARGREDLATYDVTFVDGAVTGVTRSAGSSDDGDGGFEAILEDGRTYSARALLAATGVRDELPDIPGLRSRWGIDVLHCPYCHGWEVRDQQIVILATTPMAAHSALLFRQLSADVTIVTHNGIQPTDEDAVRLGGRGVVVVDGPVSELVVEDDQLRGVRLGSGEVARPGSGRHSACRRRECRVGGARSAYVCASDGPRVGHDVCRRDGWSYIGPGAVGSRQCR